MAVSKFDQELEDSILTNPEWKYSLYPFLFSFFAHTLLAQIPFSSAMQCSHIQQRKKKKTTYCRLKLNLKQLLLKVTSATKVENSVFTSRFCESFLLLLLFVSAQKRETISMYLGITLLNIKPVGRK